MAKYTRVVSALAEHPWAILPSTLDTICSIVEARANGAPSLSTDEVRAVMRARQPEQMAVLAAAPSAGPGLSLQGNGSIAVIPLVGVLAGKMNMLSAFSGGTSLDQFRGQFRKAMADQTVKAIVISVDSPGGSVLGCQETWQEIFSARGAKPIVASVEYLMASAALWVGSACDAIEVAPSGDVGSLGVYVVHEEYSEALVKAGIKVTYIKSDVSPFKVEGNETEPLSEDAAANLQKRVNAVADTFLEQVAKGRGVTVTKAKANFGGGRVMNAKDALAAKLVDRIATFDQTIARLMVSTGMAKKAQAARFQLRPMATPPASVDLRAGVVPESVSEKLAPKDEPWSVLTLEDFTDKSWDELDEAEQRRIAGHFAWAAEMPPKSFGDLKLGHHRASDGAVVFSGVTHALGRLDQADIPAADRDQARAHLEHHEQQFEKKDDTTSAARADHTDTGRGADGRFHAQCECDPACPCMDDDTDLCPDDCMTCQPSCACLTERMASRAREDEAAIIAALS